MRTLEQAEAQAWQEFDTAFAVADAAHNRVQNVAPEDLPKLAGIYGFHDGRLVCIEGGQVKRVSQLVDDPAGQREHAHNCGRLAALHKNARLTIWDDPFIQPLLERVDSATRQALEKAWAFGRKCAA